jgi:DNA-binding protein YbaB
MVEGRLPVRARNMVRRWLGCQVILVCAALLPTTTFSWLPPGRSFCRSQSGHVSFLIETSGSGRRSSTRTSESASQLSAFLWFGGNDEKKGEGDGNLMAVSSSSALTGKDSSTLRGVSNIVDSMASFKASQRVGERTGAALQELSSILVEGTAADGKIKVTFNGQQMPVGVQIDETYLKGLLARRPGVGSSSNNNKEGIDQLCAALTEAMKEAQAKSAAKVDDKLKSLYSDLGFDS